VEIWKEWQPHLICMDIQMPFMDGYEAIKMIKKLGNRRPEPETVNRNRKPSTGNRQPKPETGNKDHSGDGKRV